MSEKLKVEEQYVLGVDIGGSHITAAAIDLHERKILKKSYTRRHLDSSSTKENILKTWKQAIFEVWTKAALRETRIGIAMPGPFDYVTGISYMLDNNKFQALYKLNVKEALAWELGIDPSDIVFNNDASCFLAGETFGGEARIYEKILGITLGTGLGSSIYDKGHIRDANLWEMPFKNGIAEDYISSRWFLRRYEELTGLKVADVKTLCAKDEYAEANGKCSLLFIAAHGRSLGRHPVRWSPAYFYGHRLVVSGFLVRIMPMDHFFPRYFCPKCIDFGGLLGSDEFHYSYECKPGLSEDLPRKRRVGGADRAT